MLTECKRQELISIIKSNSKEKILYRIFKEQSNLTFEFIEHSASFNDLSTFKTIYELYINKGIYFNNSSLLAKSISNDSSDIFFFLIEENKSDFSISYWAKIFSHLVFFNKNNFLTHFFNIINSENISRYVFNELTDKKDIEIFQKFQIIDNF